MERQDDFGIFPHSMPSLGEWLYLTLHNAFSERHIGLLADEEMLQQHPEAVVSTHLSQVWDAIISVHPEPLASIPAHRSVVHFAISSTAVPCDILIRVVWHPMLELTVLTDPSDLGHCASAKEIPIGYICGWGSLTHLTEYAAILGPIPTHAAALREMDILFKERTTLKTQHRALLNEKEHLLSAWHEEQSSMAAKIAHLTDQYQTLTADYAALKTKATQHEEEIQQLRQTLSARNAIIAALEQDLESIHQSPFWKWLHRYWRLMATLRREG